MGTLIRAKMRELGRVFEDIKMRFGEVLYFVNMGVDLNTDGRVVIAVFEFTELWLPFLDVLVEEFDGTFLEEKVIPNDAVVVVGDDKTDLAEVIGLLDVAADNVRGTKVALLTDTGNVGDDDRDSDDVNEGDNARAKSPELWFDRCLDTGRDVI